MSDDDMLRRGDAHRTIVLTGEHVAGMKSSAVIDHICAAVRALPAVQPDAAPAGNLTARGNAGQMADTPMITGLVASNLTARGNAATWALYDANLTRMGALQPAVQPVTVRLVFSNADATPKTTVLDVSAEAVPDIMAWYGAYCSGDRYTVTVDGRNVPMDQNGEPDHVNETPKSEHVPGNVLTPATKGGAEPTDAQPDLTDPNVVHANMLRGTIAKPTLEQIRHLYGDAVQIKMTMQDEAEAQLRWIAATKGESHD